MNSFLVVLRHSTDDIPLLLTSGEIEALEFAKEVKEDDGREEMNILGLDATTPICVSVYVFRHGKLIEVCRVKGFDEE